MRELHIWSYLMILYCASVESLLDEPLDLTWDVHEKTVRWPTNRPFVFSSKTAEISESGYWYAKNEFCVGERVGTHLDAPYHFNQYGWKVGDIPISRLVVTGVTINMPKITKFIDVDTYLLPDDIRKWEWLHGNIPPESVVLIKFGWYLHYGTKKYMYNETNELNFPAISKEAAEYLVSRKVFGVGVDTPAIDRDNKSEAQRLLAENNIYVLANVNFTHDVPEKSFRLLVMPMKIRAGTAAPLRLVAMAGIGVTEEYKSIKENSKISQYVFAWFTHIVVVLSLVLILIMYYLERVCNSVI